MSDEANQRPAFPGFPDFRANVTFTPIQFFTVVLPHCPRGPVRLAGYVLRRVLGWVDAQGNPTREQLRFTYRELIEGAGVSRAALAEALKEAVEHHLLRCVQSASPHLPGHAAQSAVYELCWDTTGRYTDNPAEFRGFYYPEAVVVSEPGANPRPKAARKNIPNAFFDVLLPREPLSVARVVGALLFYSIQWGPGGERREPVSRSITELARLTRLSRHHAHEAVLAALAAGYIERVTPGRFDPDAGQASEAATYAIRWTRADASESAKEQRFKKVDGASVQEGERGQFDKVNGERFKKANGISIKTELKTETAAAPAASAPGASLAAAVALLERLRQTGFDDFTARRLASQYPAEVIERQLAWLPLRHSTRNRLGLLRRAIEEDWPKPEGAPEDDRLRLGRVFASHYYAAYHGYSGEARTEPFANDIQTAGQFVERLLAVRNEPSLVPDWGRQFGACLRQKHQHDPKARPNLAPALVLHGDEFLRRIESHVSTAATAASQKAQAARQARLWPEYMAYLQLAERDAQRAAPALYAAFTAQRQRTREAMTGGLFQASAETVARFDRDESRLLALVEFCRGRQSSVTLDFDPWCKQQLSLTSSGTADEEKVVRFPVSVATETTEQPV